MRILYFSRDYTPHDHRFLQAMADSPHEVFFLRLERRGTQREDRPIPERVEQVLWRGGRAPAERRDWPALWLDLKRVLRRIKPDMVHAGPIQNAAYLAAQAGVKPLVSMSWGSDLLVDADSSERMKRVTRYTLARTRVLLGDCQAVADKAASFGFPGDRVVLFPWGVDLEHFTPRDDGQAAALRERLGWQDCFVLLSNRAWETIYGVDVAVRGFIQAARALPELRLLLLGTGSLAPDIRAMIEQGGVQNRVHLGGQVSNAELVKYYRAADLYVSASHSDGSSVSLLEALACGKPALVSDIPGNREWVRPGQHGWLFPVGDADMLAEEIVSAARHPDRLAQMSINARGLAKRRADWKQNSRKLFEAYQMAIELGKR